MALGACALALVAAAPAQAVAVVAADTTRATFGSSDPLAAGRSTSLTAGGGEVALLRFQVRGLGGPPARAVLRLRVTAASIGGFAVRRIAAGFGEDDGTPATLSRWSTTSTSRSS